MAFNLSDVVVDPLGNEGVIVQIIPQNSGIDKYMVEFDSKIVPQRVEYTGKDLKKAVEEAGPVGLPFGVMQPKLTSSYKPPECTCGVKFVRDGGKHSDYCELYGKD